MFKSNLKIKKSAIQNLKIFRPPLSNLESIQIQDSIRMQKIRRRHKNPNLKKMYAISDLPQKDKEKLRPSHDKFQAVNAIPKYIQDKSTAYDVYDLNITFKKNHRQYFYSEFLYLFRRKIDQLLNIDHTNDRENTILVMTQERKPMIHYHGFLLVHKRKAAKFHKSCVEKIVTEYVDALKSTKDAFYLKSIILNPPTPKMREHGAIINEAMKKRKQLKPLLPESPLKLSKKQRDIQIQYLRAVSAKEQAEDKKYNLRIYEPEESPVYTHKLYKITDAQEFFNKNFYNSKYLLIDNRLSLDDIVFEAKPAHKKEK